MSNITTCLRTTLYTSIHLPKEMTGLYYIKVVLGFFFVEDDFKYNGYWYNEYTYTDASLNLLILMSLNRIFKYSKIFTLQQYRSSMY